ncbi:hypothetical protein MtrunA17_Chr3g0093461 [Medicago truncatula]|uniref:Uncharacterized protein n=1 Tax=Medicago truncatula TaxID=3880 RepID=A0A396ILS1_MEDTR|nr:hypothetical protein MtrunA17_Chr3g0093461 [Medicago truncatula]
MSDQSTSSSSDPPSISDTSSAAMSEESDPDSVAEEVCHSSIYVDYNSTFKLYPCLVNPSRKVSLTSSLARMESFCIILHITQRQNIIPMYMIDSLKNWVFGCPSQNIILRILNVAPTQLHPRAWSFVRSFEVSCGGISFSPSAYAFFSFFLAKISNNSWVYMSNFFGRPLVRPYHASWKGIHSFKEKFFRVRPGPKFP